MSDIFGYRREWSLFEKFVQMVEHVKLVESEWGKSCVGESCFKRIFDLSEKLLHLILLVVRVVFNLVTYRVVITHKSFGPVFKNIAEVKKLLTRFTWPLCRWFSMETIWSELKRKTQPCFR